MSIKKLFENAVEITSQKGFSGLTNSALLKIQNYYLPTKMIGSPIFAQIETTTHCNLECYMCPRSYDGKVKKGNSPCDKTKKHGF